MEDMLIARIKSYMQVRWTKGRQLCYNDHIINFRQDITDIVTKLPRLPEETDIVIIRKDDVDLSQHVDFIVRRDKVKAALEYKIVHDPEYADLTIDHEALNGLPENDSVADRLPTCREGRQDGAAAMPVGPDAAAAAGTEDGGGCHVGGILELGNPERPEIEQLRRGAREAIQGTRYEQTIVSCYWHSQATHHGDTFKINAPPCDPVPISESTPGYMTRAFPTLFPDGAGDFYQARLRKVDLGEYFAHLLRFRGSRFAQHRRFPWFAFNTLQRSRTRSLAKIFVRQQHDARRLTAEDIQAMLAENDEHIANQMIRYGSKLRGTRAYWLARRHELMDMIRRKGSPHIFFTLSAADLQWPDLHQHMPAAGIVPNDPGPARQKRRMALNSNPHVAAAYLDRRLQIFFKHFMVPLLGIRDYWYRFEWQERGSGHIHGFLWLKDAPKADEIDWDLLQKPEAIIPDEQTDKICQFIEYWNRIITASSPFPRLDDNMPLLGEHPCSLSREGLENTKQELADLLNWTERHTKCMPGYCLVKRNVPGHDAPKVFCRFDYPMPLRHDAGVGTDSKGRVRFEPERNDRLMNPYNAAMILGWRANIDLKPVLNKEAAINYIAKYASKAEKQAPAFPELLAGIVNEMEREGTATLACTKMLNKMLGERTYSAQETAHLLLGIPLVRASTTFQTIYIGAEGGFRELGTEEGAMANGEGENNPAATTESWLQRYMTRPPDMEDLSLQDVLSKYNWSKSMWKKKRDKTDVVLRVYPRFSPNPEDDRYDDFCRTKIILHHPFRDLDAIRDDQDQPWAEVYARCRAAEHDHPHDTLRCWEEENKEGEGEEDEDEELVNPDVMEMDEADWQAWARLRPNNTIPLYDACDVGRRPIDDGWDIDAAHGRWNNINLLSSWIDEQKCEAPQPEDDTPRIDVNTLEAEQRTIFDKYITAYSNILAGNENNDPPQMLFNIDGTAGCGKTYLISAICQALRTLASVHHRPDPIRVLAPSGVAALNIHGRTLHSGFSLPLNGFAPLTGSRLANIQLLWEGVYFVIIDEKSMLGLRTLAQIDSRCRQLFPQNADTPFGNVCVALVGDFAQLPPVGDTPLYSPPSSLASDNGCLSRDGSALYRLFRTSFQLQVVHRQGGNSPEQIMFRNLLSHASRGGLHIDEWKLLDSRSQNKLSAETQQLFEDSVCLYTTRSDVHDLNMTKLQALNLPCARVVARHDGGSPAQAAKVAADEAGGLENHIYLAKGAKVMITRNIWQMQGTLTCNFNPPLFQVLHAASGTE